MYYCGTPTFTVVDLGALREKKPKVFTKVLRELLELYRLKELMPVTPLDVFSFSEIQKAFRWMESGKHTGKIFWRFGGGAR
jgi:NADPH:quinone reductase-like Zn-dependent oxidoreductase